ncbi:GspE/PulE family protein [Patescibacteria group bacterium]|nr:GspE/PulE family protein [Patescibacteria group bacterium]
MSDFQTIGDLSNNQTQSGSGGLQVSSGGVEEKLAKKMGQVALKDREAEAMRLAQSVGLPHIDLESFPVGPQALRQIPLERAKKIGAVCFFADQEEYRVGAMDPGKEEVQVFLKELEDKNQANTALYVISKKSFDKVVELYKTLPTVKAITKDVSIKESDLESVQVDVTDLSSLQRVLEDANATTSFVSILASGLKLDASDIHIEAEENGIEVRVRLDGVLHDAAKLPRETYRQIVSRIKLVSALKLNITDKPQDGRFSIKLKGGDVDVRVSTIPTVYGESIVMRLLAQSREGVSLESLGLSEDDYNILKREIERPNGMIITTGPTGSGKSTTLYAIMKILNKPGVKIITLEDPVEYKVEGINQSQVEPDKGYTFAKGLKSMMRQDPDIAMVGEIRDLETAETAVQASLTGHLILSTLHTNSAAGAVPRFLSMGTKPFLLAPALNCIIGQRLVRKLCESCKEPSQIEEGRMEEIKAQIAKMPEKLKKLVETKELKFFSAPGCKACGSIGYKGRIGIYEIFVVNEDAEKRILAGEISEYDIAKIAQEQGMVTMIQDGILKALDGITSIDEVHRVIE